MIDAYLSYCGCCGSYPLITGYPSDFLKRCPLCDFELTPIATAFEIAAACGANTGQEPDQYNVPINHRRHSTLYPYE